MTLTAESEALLTRLLEDGYWSPGMRNVIRAALPAIEAAARADADARIAALEAALTSLYYRLESLWGTVTTDHEPDVWREAVVQDVYFTFTEAEKVAERFGIIGPAPEADR